MSTLLIILGIAVAAWFWSDSLRARERVLRACASACEQTRVQFLDQTVSLARIGLKRDRGGQVRLHRTYGFEFSTDGADRWPGRCVLLGLGVESLQMDRPQGVTFLQDRDRAGKA